MWSYKDIITNFYKDKECSKEKRFIPFFENNITIESYAIGDTVTLTHIPKMSKLSGLDIKIYSPSDYFETLMQFNEYYEPVSKTKLFPIERVSFFDFGGGHTIQRAQKALGLKVSLSGTGYIRNDSVVKKNKIGLHLSVGSSANIPNHPHSRNRQFYQENIPVLLNFINNNPQFEFVEFGGIPRLQHDRVKNFCGTSLKESILELGTCEYFVGTNSGFMNVASAMSIKSIIVLNWPRIEELYLPLLVHCGIGDGEWLYPKNCHLHQDGENELIPKFSEENILRAINGDVYPYWGVDHLSLLQESDCMKGFNYEWVE